MTALDHPPVSVRRDAADRVTAVTALAADVHLERVDLRTWRVSVGGAVGGAVLGVLRYVNGEVVFEERD